MNFLDSPIDKTEQMQKIIDDTDEIIKNFKEISEIIAERIEHGQDSMLNLGRKMVNQNQNKSDPRSSLGGNQVNIL